MRTDWNNCNKASRPSAEVSELNCRLARTTTSTEYATEKLSRNICRIIRFAKFLDTAFGMLLLLAINPRRE